MVSVWFRVYFPFSYFSLIVFSSLFHRPSFRWLSQYSTLGSDVQFTCQHGPNECYGNKVHSCALEHIQVSVEFCATSFVANDWIDRRWTATRWCYNEFIAYTFRYPGGFLSKHTNTWIAVPRLCQLSDEILSSRQRTICRWTKMCSRIATEKLECDWTMCQHHWGQ